MNVPRKELSSRLAWLAQWTAGQWDLSDEADKFYESWYIKIHTHYDTLRFHPAQKSRFAIHVLKVALLFSAQRYSNHLERKNRTIDLAAVKEAIRLVEATMELAVPLIEETEANPVQRLQIRILNYITERKKVTRKMLMQNAHLTAGEATATISDLYQAGRITCAKGGAPSFDMDEAYVLVHQGRGKEIAE